MRTYIHGRRAARPAAVERRRERKNKSDEGMTHRRGSHRTRKQTGVRFLFGRVLPAQNADCGYDDAQKSVFRQNKKTSSQISTEKFR